MEFPVTRSLNPEGQVEKFSSSFLGNESFSPPYEESCPEQNIFNRIFKSVNMVFWVNRAKQFQTWLDILKEYTFQKGNIINRARELTW